MTTPGAVAPELDAFRAALPDAERPDIALAWIPRAKARDLLERVGQDERPVTHDVLDELPPGKVLAHLRRLRRRVDNQRTNQRQDMNVRCHVTAADNFLAWLAGVHIQVAVQWQKASAGDRAACAADISQRQRHMTEAFRGFRYSELIQLETTREGYP